MRVVDVVRCWGRILSGYRPELTVEVTRECPLRCPGCYAYAPQHVGGEFTLRSVADVRGQLLVDGVLELVRAHRPLHVTLVGGEPLVRYREMEALVPRLMDTGLHVQVVTSAVLPIPSEWDAFPRLNLSVSVDGLPPEHDAPRKPATYDRILKHVNGHRVTIHCTITGQQMQRDGYLEEFVRFWSAQACAKRIWMSTYTPQVGESSPECLSDDDRRRAITELKRLRDLYPKLDMGQLVFNQLLDPPSSPRECALADLATCISADLRTPLTPCQLGGTPDCSRCGCMAAAGVGAIERYKLFGVLPLKVLVIGSEAIGGVVRRLRRARDQGHGTGDY
jgi:sulfatase maturation enzyme AslB (radical SAM superfamily)